MREIDQSNSTEGRSFELHVAIEFHSWHPMWSSEASAAVEQGKEEEEERRTRRKREEEEEEEEQQVSQEEEEELVGQARIAFSSNLPPPPTQTQIRFRLPRIRLAAAITDTPTLGRPRRPQQAFPGTPALVQHPRPTPWQGRCLESYQAFRPQM